MSRKRRNGYTGLASLLIAVILMTLVVMPVSASQTKSNTETHIIPKEKPSQSTETGTNSVTGNPIEATSDNNETPIDPDNNETPIVPDKQEVTIKFNGNGGKASKESQTLEIGTSITVTATRTGYIFQGWYTTTSGGKRIVSAEKDTTTLYAIWKPISYTIVYDANNGKGSMKVTAGEYDKSLNLAANTFTRKGYTFVGWTTNKNGTGNFYKDKQSVKNLINTPSGKITLYAYWTTSLGKPAIKSLTNNSAKTLRVKISKRIKGAAGYEIAYSTSKKFTKSETKVANKTKLDSTINKLKKNKTYFVKVRAWKKVKGIKVYGSYSQVKNKKTKK